MKHGTKRALVPFIAEALFAGPAVADAAAYASKAQAENTSALRNRLAPVLRMVRSRRRPRAARLPVVVAGYLAATG